MKAAVLNKKNQNLEIKEISIPEIDEDEVKVIFALSKRIPNTELYSYVGYKNLELKYIDNRFVIKNIKTSLN